MPSSSTKRRFTAFDYVSFGRDSTPSGMQHTTKAIKPRSLFAVPVDVARWLDLQAGVELAHGHTQAAETLSRRAAEMREARQ
ncbi:MAG: hypothetical protein ACRYHQ_31230 [Janthinobacterium lividum]